MAAVIHRRLRRVRISPEMFIQVMKDGLDAALIVENPLPADAMYVGEVFDPASLSIWLVVESASFAEVPEGADLPFHPMVVFTKKFSESVFEGQVGRA